MKEIAFFTGSFDPITNGHLHIIKRASKMFEHVVVGVFDNPKKNYWWSSSMRVSLIEESCKDLTNVSVKSFDHRLVLDVAKEIKATFIIKGLRNSLDYEYEKALFQVQFDEGELETVYLMTSKEYSHISSSLVKELAEFAGPYENYVPNCVACAIAKKMKE